MKKRGRSVSRREGEKEFLVDNKAGPYNFRLINEKKLWGEVNGKSHLETRRGMRRLNPRLWSKTQMSHGVLWTPEALWLTSLSHICQNTGGRFSCLLPGLWLGVLECRYMGYGVRLHVLRTKFPLQICGKNSSRRSHNLAWRLPQHL